MPAPAVLRSRTQWSSSVGIECGGDDRVLAELLACTTAGPAAEVGQQFGSAQQLVECCPEGSGITRCYEDRGVADAVLDDRTARALAAGLADRLARDAALRDRERILPWDEIARLKRSGLLALTVLPRYGGPGASVATLTEVVQWVASQPQDERTSQYQFLNQMDVHRPWNK